MWTVLVLLGAGCSLELPDAPATESVKHCEAAGDCVDGQVCEVGFCVVPTTERELVAVQLTPPNTSEYLTEQFPSVELEQGSELPDLQLLRPVLLTGTVLSPGEDGLTPVAAQLLLRRVNPSIEGRNLRFQSQSTRDTGFALQLPQGEYDITVLPERTDLPPHTLRGVPVQVDVNYDVEFPAKEDYTRLRGRVVYTNADGQNMPLAGIRVRAVDESDATVSTTIETLEDGLFEVLVRDTESEVDLVLSPVEEVRILPRVVVNRVDLTGKDVQLGDQSLGVVQPHGRPVYGVVQGEDGVPVPGARMVFSGAVGNGIVSVTAETDTAGTFDLRLPAGRYAVVLVPGADSEYAVTELNDIDLTASGDVPDALAELQLPRKALVTGTMLNPVGEPIPEAVVEFRLQFLNSAAAAAGTQNVSTRTDADGRFELRVHAGVYEIEAVPGEGSGWARGTTAGVEIGRDGAEIDVIASPGNVAYGRVLAPDATPMPDVLVEIFRSADGAPRLVGMGRTDESGSYVVLVPAITAADYATNAP
jgi:hypothetical protein